MKPTTLISIVVLFAAMSCHSNDRAKLFESKIQQHYAQQEYSNIDLKKIKAIIFLPREGCEGCISEASEMAIHFLEERNDIALVFTIVNDLKLLKRQYGNTILDNDLVSIDFQNMFGDARVSSIYPQIAYLQDGKCYKVEEFNSESEDFIKLFTLPN